MENRLIFYSQDVWGGRKEELYLEIPLYAAIRPSSGRIGPNIPLPVPRSGACSEIWTRGLRAGRPTLTQIVVQIHGGVRSIRQRYGQPQAEAYIDAALEFSGEGCTR